MREILDRGREQAYRAERRVFGRGRPFDTCGFPESDVRAMVATIVGKRVAERCEFRRGRGGALAFPGMGLIRFTTNEKGNVAAWVVLHECAHLLAPKNAWHDDEWRAIYVRLVREWVGEAAALALAEAFRTEPLRRKETRPRSRWVVMVREDVGERPLFSVPCPNDKEASGHYARAKSMTLPGEIVRGLWAGRRVTYWAVLSVERPATEQEIARIPAADRAAMRHGVCFKHGSNTRSTWARRVPREVAKAATKAGGS